MDDHFDAIVLGAGMSGLVSAAILARETEARVLVLDEYEQVGGNHIDRKIGPYTFDIGSFIFQDDSPLIAHFPELLDLYVEIDPTFGRLNPQGRVTAYPMSFRDDILASGPVEVARIAGSVLMSRAFRRNQTNAWTFARYWVGDHFLHRSGLGKYMERFYGRPADEIDLEFARKRMMWLKEHGQVSTYVNRVLKPPSQRGPTNRQQARPREGFAELYAPVVERLRAEGVSFEMGRKPVSVARSDDGFVVTIGDREVQCARVVGTIPLVTMLALCGLPFEEDLQSVELTSLFYSFDGERGYPHSVLFNFSHGGAWKRLTTYSDFYGRADGREYFGVEVTNKSGDGSPEAADQSFREHVQSAGLFKGDLRLEGTHSLQSAYPVYTPAACIASARAIRRLREFGIESFGRQGGFDYQPTARVSALRAEEVLRAGRAN